MRIGTGGQVERPTSNCVIKSINNEKGFLSRSNAGSGAAGLVPIGRTLSLGMEALKNTFICAKLLAIRWNTWTSDSELVLRIPPPGGI
jgi:hypothetical protein